MERPTTMTGLLRSVAGDLATWLALGGVVFGLVKGWLDVSEEGYLANGLTFLALDTFRTAVFDVLIGGAMVMGVTAIVVLTGRFLLGLKPRGLWLGLFVVALVAVALERNLGHEAMFWYLWHTPLERILVGVAIVVTFLSVVHPRRVPRLAPAWLAAAFLLVPVGFAVLTGLSWQGKKEDVAGRPNFLILVLDALRADHTTHLGYEKKTTPTIDGLAAEGYTFTNAVSNSVATRYTVPSIMTLFYPEVHGIRNDGQALSRRFITLAEHMREEGYATAAWAANPSLKKRFRIGQGFAHYDDQVLNPDPDLPMWQEYETAKRFNERALEWIRSTGNRPWLIYMHYRDPHTPYAPPPSYRDMFYDRKPGEPPIRPITKEEYARQRTPDMMVEGDDKGDLAWYIAQYDASIRYNDDEIGKFLSILRREGRLENTVIFVSADHGEGFLEHGRWTHGNVIYDEAIHVPLVVRLPEPTDRPVRIDSPVHTFDIARTVLDLSGIEPRVEVQARSLMPLLRGEKDSIWEHAYIEKKEVAALRDGEWKYIIRRKDGRLEEELYDIAEDPGETKDLARAHPDRVMEFRRKALAIQKMNEDLGGDRRAEEMALDPKTIEELRSLGYLK
jgi:arylsulfatase A-like enzyme